MSLDAVGIGSVADLIKSGIDKIWPDKTEAERQQATMALAALQGDLDLAKAQLEVNKVEAASHGFFQSGWRPFIGWTCGLSFAWNYVGIGVAQFIASLLEFQVILKPVDLSQMLPVLMGMLGLGAYRTYERVRGKIK